MTQQTDLKPCPFCGATAIVRSSHDADGCYWAHVECTVCRARTSGDWASSSSETCPLFYEGVREAWQTRAALEAEQAVLPVPAAHLYHDATSLEEFISNERAGLRVNSALFTVKRMPSYRNETPLYTAAQVRALLAEHGITVCDANQQKS